MTALCFARLTCPARTLTRSHESKQERTHTHTCRTHPHARAHDTSLALTHVRTRMRRHASACALTGTHLCTRAHVPRTRACTRMRSHAHSHARTHSRLACVLAPIHAACDDTCAHTHLLWHMHTSTREHANVGAQKRTRMPARKRAQGLLYYVVRTVIRIA